MNWLRILASTMGFHRSFTGGGSPERKRNKQIPGYMGYKDVLKTKAVKRNLSWRTTLKGPR